ncbi:hypothetical protein SAMN05421686_10468, partial [Thalassolituus maritimus]
IVGANQPEAIRDDPSAGITVAISQASWLNSSHRYER